MLLRPHTTFCFPTASTTRAHALDLDTKRWHRYTHNVVPGVTPGQSGRITTCALDRAAKRVYHSFGYIDLEARKQVSKTWGWNHTNLPHNKTVFDGARRLWLGANCTASNGNDTSLTGALLATSPDAGTGFVQLKMQGDVWPRGYAAYGGLVHCPNLGCYFLYNALNSNATIQPIVGPEVVYKIIPPATNPLTNPWTVTKEIMGGTPPRRDPIGRAIGSLGRFFWIQSIKCLGFINGASMPVYVYKPRGL